MVKELLHNISYQVSFGLNRHKPPRPAHDPYFLHPTNDATPGERFVWQQVSPEDYLRVIKKYPGMNRYAAFYKPSETTQAMAQESEQRPHMPIAPKDNLRGPLLELETIADEYHAYKQLFAEAIQQDQATIEELFSVGTAQMYLSELAKADKQKKKPDSLYDDSNFRALAVSGQYLCILSDACLHNGATDEETLEKMIEVIGRIDTGQFDNNLNNGKGHTSWQYYGTILGAYMAYTNGFVTIAEGNDRIEYVSNRPGDLATGIINQLRINGDNHQEAHAFVEAYRAAFSAPNHTVHANLDFQKLAHHINLTSNQHHT
ncbi:MAG: hypothetical protein ACOCXQ_01775 [Patescibacteria group bacterium]